MTVTALAGLALVTACSAEEQQASTELPSASSSSAEPTPELPPLGPADMPMPDEARSKDEDGAEAFLRYYMDVYNHAQQTMDPTHLRQLSAGCDRCDGIADDVDMDAADGYAYQGGQVTIDDLSASLVKGLEAQLVFSVTQEALVVAQDGAPVEGLSFPEISTQGDGAILRWDSARQTWVIRQWDVNQ